MTDTRQAFTSDEKLQAVIRELGYRRRVYARRVAEKKMTQAQATKEIAVFEAIEADYRALAEKERLR